MSSHSISRLLDNLATARQRLAAAARRSGRATEAVTMVAVTKYVNNDVIRELVAAGCRDLGEARPQALWAKAASLAHSFEKSAFAPTPVRWHLVGHLQRNKVEQTLPIVSLIHSADSLRLLQAIDESAATLARQAPVLIEVNVSGDESKHGFAPHEVGPALSKMATLKHVRVQGLMCMAAREGDQQVARRDFASLHELRDRLLANTPENISLDELSMGMSGDFEVAVEEGATLVRIGSALFEGVDA